MPSPCTALPPGFRFHPTDEELILHYLRKRAAAAPCPAPVIAEVDIYKFDPWDLPAMAIFGEAEWYFFSPRDRKYPNGVRPNRAAGSGYWKATGTDKPITLSSSSSGAGSAAAPDPSSDSRAMIGVKKALVFYKGRPPKGLKTSWIMHEYRLAEALAAANTYRPMRFKNSSMRLDDWVLCRIYKKTTPQLYCSPPHDDETSMDGGLDLGRQPDGSSASVGDIVAAYAPAGGLPRPASISDYLVDFNYSPVSELLESMPAPETAAQLGTMDATGRLFYAANHGEAAASSSSTAQQQSSHKRRFMEDYSNSDLNLLHASSSKRVISDQLASSMASNLAFSSVFEPGQTSLPDRI